MFKLPSSVVAVSFNTIVYVDVLKSISLSRLQLSLPYDKVAATVII